MNHHPGAIDIDTYLRATRKSRGLFRTRAATVGAVVALALGSAAAGNLAPRWGGEHLKDGNFEDAVELAADAAVSESRREVALNLLTQTSLAGLNELLTLAETDSGSIGNKAAIRGRRILEVSIKRLRRMAARGGWGAQRAEAAIRELGLRD